MKPLSEERNEFQPLQITFSILANNLTIGKGVTFTWQPPTQSTVSAIPACTDVPPPVPQVPNSGPFDARVSLPEL